MASLEPSEDALATFRRNYPSPLTPLHSEGSKSGGPGDTFDGMGRIWDKLAEQDKRFDRIETQMADVAKELSNAKFWFVGTALGLGVGSLGLIYSARQDTTATIGAALSAIQTVIAAKQETPPAAPPMVIVVPQPQVPFIPPPIATTPKKPENGG